MRLGEYRPWLRRKHIDPSIQNTSGPPQCYPLISANHLQSPAGNSYSPLHKHAFRPHKLQFSNPSRFFTNSSLHKKGMSNTQQFPPSHSKSIVPLVPSDSISTISVKTTQPRWIMHHPSLLQPFFLPHLILNLTLLSLWLIHLAFHLIHSLQTANPRNQSPHLHPSALLSINCGRLVNFLREKNLLHQPVLNHSGNLI